ncbi:hypothetical protein INR76_10145 [Marixanthomonas sp. SCSIO 43207]|uniref:hypothetical protein n=1 Tax=Marixanthomonas sp. SCSIO 43207 TaxID=2779360 RepID=UPI001CA84F3F|nr:hypothetical protein [Marixanthomonas sp. SCSIO 43207]UAB80475.1 hypothetical protein INR76_10145 [Marixanthomonas sp. SCSIO 43207]
MKNLLLLTFLITSIGFSQSKYEVGMQKAFDLWQEDKVWEAANMFERIAQAEQEKWLPPYYVAQINVIKSFGEKDKTKISAQLEKAQDFINLAKTNSNENPEILVLEAQWYTAWIAFDGQQYGMKYSGKVQQLYSKALEIAPNNPRVILSKAEWDMGSAKFFNQPLDPYCKDIRRAIELFATFKPEGKFYPTCGEDRARMILDKNCKE